MLRKFLALTEYFKGKYPYMKENSRHKVNTILCKPDRNEPYEEFLVLTEKEYLKLNSKLKFETILFGKEKYYIF